MSGWPSLDHSDDRRLAEALAAGDADAMPQIFDGHAARLFDYCHALLRDADLAASALHDTFLAAAAHAGRLQDPDRFRSWLYALVRNECLRRLHDPERPAQGMVRDPYTGQIRPRQEAPEVEDAYLDEAERARRQETRELVHSALSGLSGRQREALDLLLRHALEPVEIAGVLGLSEAAAEELAGEAQARLDDALAAAVIARTGREDCPSVAALVDGAGWPLTQAECRKLIRHIETCPACTERRSRTVSGGRLLGALPVAQMPQGLRGAVLSALAVPLDEYAPPEIAEVRMAAAQRAEPFDESGWPVPVEQPGRRPGHGGRSGSDSPRLWPALAAAVVVMLVVGGAFWVLPSSSKSPTDQALPTSAAAEPTDSASDSPSETEEPSESPETTPTVTPTTPSASPSPSSPEPRPSTRSPRPTRRPTQPVSGTLAVSGCTIPEGASSCAITLTARGGRVRWSVISSRGVSASGAGTLQKDASTSVTATRPDCGEDERGGSGTVFFSPSGAAPVNWVCPAPPSDDDPPPGGGG